ncbi:MarR family winged helix-turn-helix transcriptional regulator [Desulfobacula toluolica]|uniref:Transcriptional regulator, MarR family n=1 Tax=Desulfobacula toluolica (strain DSM 7467 / Tol2) TaxID=651182 RepID=K0NJ16_DESTT|nr:MarR family transcriptional regulator [Desulfobacula toluolica]CCK81461.1 transcriptional regulator, MarR family [Desulfobacula toluolica Tol2]
MENKADIIKKVIQAFRSAAVKYCRGEELPIRVNTDVTASTREVHMIQAIGDNEQLGVTELARLFGTSKSAASQLVSRLSKKGFLKKKSSRKNNKEVRLVLTDLGWEAYKTHEQYHSKDMDYLVGKMETFSMSQIAMFLVMLESLDDIMEQRIEE